jgi:predicted metal-dependent hydrolase
VSDDERIACMRAGRDAWNRGDFFAAHEHWERVWLRAAPPERAWLQGLIQAATALHKLERGRPDLARSLLDKALAKLHVAPAALDALDVEALRGALGRSLVELAAGRAVDPRAIPLADA